MRLRSARLAAAEENETSSEPTVTTRQSKRRTMSRKADTVEADQPAAAEQSLLATSHQLEIDAVSPHKSLPGHAAAHLHHAESPVFDAQAAAEAARIAEALLRSHSPSEQPCTAIAIPAAALPRQSSHSVNDTGVKACMTCSEAAAPVEQAACIQTNSASGQKSAARITFTASAEPGQTGQDEQVPPSIAHFDSNPDISPHPDHSAMSLRLYNDETQAMTAQEHYNAARPAHNSPERRRLTGRASLALQSRRMSRSGTAEAFTRGRKSGIWLGSADVKLGNIEQQWDKYKATSQRGWALPKLEELHAKSRALENSGYTTVHSPKLRASSRSALTQARPGNQLKRKAEDAALAGQISKAAKTGAELPMSPRKRLAIRRSEAASKAARPEAIVQTTVKPVPACSAAEHPSNTAAQAGSPGRSAGAGSATWAPSPSRFRRNAQENRELAPASRKGAGDWVR